MTFSNGFDHNIIALIVSAVFLGYGLYEMVAAFVPELRPKDTRWRFRVNYGPWKVGQSASARSIFILGAAFFVIGLVVLYGYTGRTDDFPAWLPVAIFFGAILSVFATAALDNLP